MAEIEAAGGTAAACHLDVTKEETYETLFSTFSMTVTELNFISLFCSNFISVVLLELYPIVLLELYFHFFARTFFHRFAQTFFYRFARTFFYSFARTFPHRFARTFFYNFARTFFSIICSEFAEAAYGGVDHVFLNAGQSGVMKGPSDMEGPEGA